MHAHLITRAPMILALAAVVTAINLSTMVEAQDIPTTPARPSQGGAIVREARPTIRSVPRKQRVGTVRRTRRARPANPSLPTMRPQIARRRAIPSVVRGGRRGLIAREQFRRRRLRRQPHPLLQVPGPRAAVPGWIARPSVGRVYPLQRPAVAPSNSAITANQLPRPDFGQIVPGNALPAYPEPDFRGSADGFDPKNSIPRDVPSAAPPQESEFDATADLLRHLTMDLPSNVLPANTADGISPTDVKRSLNAAADEPTTVARKGEQASETAVLGDLTGDLRQSAGEKRSASNATRSDTVASHGRKHEQQSQGPVQLNAGYLDAVAAAVLKESRQEQSRRRFQAELTVPIGSIEVVRPVTVTRAPSITTVPAATIRPPQLDHETPPSSSGASPPSEEREVPTIPADEPVGVLDGLALHGPESHRDILTWNSPGPDDRIVFYLGALGCTDVTDGGWIEVGKDDLTMIYGVVVKYDDGTFRAWGDYLYHNWLVGDPWNAPRSRIDKIMVSVNMFPPASEVEREAQVPGKRIESIHIGTLMGDSDPDGDFVRSMAVHDGFGLSAFMQSINWGRYDITGAIPDALEAFIKDTDPDLDLIGSNQHNFDRQFLENMFFYAVRVDSSAELELLVSRPTELGIEESAWYESDVPLGSYRPDSRPLTDPLAPSSFYRRGTGDSSRYDYYLHCLVGPGTVFQPYLPAIPVSARDPDGEPFVSEEDAAAPAVAWTTPWWTDDADGP